MKRFLLTILILINTSTYATESWYMRHKEGWHWYNDPEKKTKKKKPLAPPNPEATQDPLEWAEAVRKKGEWLQAQALRENNETNVLAYIDHQQQQSERAVKFSETWDHVIRKNPKYDFSSTNPTTQFARKIYWDVQNQKTDEVLTNFSKKYGLLFFFDSKCPYSHAQAPIVQQVATKHKIELLGVSIDGGAMPELENIENDNGISSKLGVFSTPAIFAVDFTNDEAFPLATGNISGNDLETRILGVVEYESLL